VPVGMIPRLLLPLHPSSGGAIAVLQPLDPR